MTNPWMSHLSDETTSNFNQFSWTTTTTKISFKNNYWLIFSHVLNSFHIHRLPKLIINYDLIPPPHTQTQKTFDHLITLEICLLSNNIMDYRVVAQGKTTIPNVDDGDEFELTDVRSIGSFDPLPFSLNFVLFPFENRFCFSSFTRFWSRTRHGWPYAVALVSSFSPHPRMAPIQDILPPCFFFKF